MNKIYLNRCIYLFTIFLFVTSIIVISNYLYKNWALIVKLNIKSLNLLCLFICSLLLLLMHLLYIYVWKKLLFHFDVNLSYFKLSKIHFSTLLIKYIPGKIFYPLTKGYLIKRNGISYQKSFRFVLYDVFLGFGSNIFILVIFGIINFWHKNFKLVFMLLFTYSFYFISSIKNTKSVDKDHTLWGISLKFFMPYCFLAILDGIIFYIFVTLFVSTQHISFSILVSINSATKAIFGVLPNNVDIGELVQLLFLKHFIPAPFFVVIPIAMRIWKMILEMSILFILLIITCKDMFRKILRINAA